MGSPILPAQNALFLPPTAGPLSESKAVEAVLFLRDNVADLAWGVEGLVQDGLERLKIAAPRGSGTAPFLAAIPRFRRIKSKPSFPTIGSRLRPNGLQHIPRGPNISLLEGKCNNCFSGAQIVRSRRTDC